MKRTQKEHVVEELTARLRAAETLLVADYRGLTMPQIDRLRSRLLESGARFSVVKNTLTRRAADAAGETRVLEIRGGVLQGRPLTAAEVEQLAALPPTEVLQGQVLAAIVAPLTALAGLVAAPLQNLVGLLDARIEQLRESGGLDAAPAETEHQPTTSPRPQAENMEES